MHPRSTIYKRNSQRQYQHKKYKKNYNLHSLEVKAELVDYIYNSLEISKYRYKLLTSFDDLKFMKENKHFVSPNFSGTNYLMVFVKIKNCYYSILIDRKTLKYNKSYLQVENVKIFPIRIKASTNIYKGTIFDGKIIHAKDGKKVYMITDVFYLEGKNITDDNIDNKLIQVQVYLDKYIKQDTVFSKMVFDINKLYNYNQIEEMIAENKDHENYNMYGIIFYPMQSGMTILFNKLKKEAEKEEEEKIVKINKESDLLDSNMAYIQLKKTDITDVYETFILDDNDMLVKNGVAYIPTIETSQYCDKVFDKVKNNQPVIFKCIYSDAFKKWLPIEEANHVPKPDSLEKIRDLLS